MAKMKSLKDKLDKLKEHAKPGIDDALAGLIKPLIEEKEVEELLNTLKEPVVEEKKEQPKVIEVKPEPKKINVVKVNPDNHIGYNVYWDDTLKKYCMVTIEYNIPKNVANIIKTEELADNSAVALHKLNAIISLKLLKKTEIL